MGKHIELIARGLCIENGALLICVNAEQGYGYLPGGHVEFGESVAEALAREFNEECGIEVICHPPTLGLELAFEQSGRLRHEVSIVFPVKRTQPLAPVISREPRIRFEWWSIESLSGRDLRPTIMRDWVAAKVQRGTQPPTTMEWVSAMIRSHNP